MGIPAWLVRQASVALFGAPFALRAPAVVRQWEDRVAHQPKEAFAAAVRAWSRRPDLRQQLRLVAVPTLVVSGSADRGSAPGAGEALAAGIAGARHVVIPDAGHTLPLEAPEALCRLLDEAWRSG
jgi:3-oxoadipate enol-lactonase